MAVVRNEWSVGGDGSPEFSNRFQQLSLLLSILSEVQSKFQIFHNLNDRARFYSLLGRLERRIGGPRPAERCQLSGGRAQGLSAHPAETPGLGAKRCPSSAAAAKERAEVECQFLTPSQINAATHVAVAHPLGANDPAGVLIPLAFTSLFGSLHV